MTVDDVGKEIDIEIAVQEVRSSGRQAAQALGDNVNWQWQVRLDK